MTGRNKILEGLEAALECEWVKQAIHDWVRDDAPVAIKFTIRPEHVAKLVDRICGSRTSFAE